MWKLPFGYMGEDKSALELLNEFIIKSHPMANLCTKLATPNDGLRRDRPYIWIKGKVALLSLILKLTSKHHQNAY